MGAAGSKTIVGVDAAGDRYAGKIPQKSQLRMEPGCRGTKRHHVEEMGSRSPKKLKTAVEHGSQIHLDLGLRSPRSSGCHGKSVDLATSISQCAGTSAMNVSKNPADKIRYELDDFIGSAPVFRDGQQIVVSPRFYDTVRSLRQGSEAVPSGWVEAATACISMPQREQNVTLIRKAIACLRGLYLTPTYDRANLCPLKTNRAVNVTETGSCASRRTSVQPASTATTQRESRIVNGFMAAALGDMPEKIPVRGKRILDGQSHRHVGRRRDPKGVSSHTVKHDMRALEGIWRKDEWSGWSGLLKKES